MGLAGQPARGRAGVPNSPGVAGTQVQGHQSDGGSHERGGAGGWAGRWAATAAQQERYYAIIVLSLSGPEGPTLLCATWHPLLEVCAPSMLRRKKEGGAGVISGPGRVWGLENQSTVKKQLRSEVKEGKGKEREEEREGDEGRGDGRRARSGHGGGQRPSIWPGLGPAGGRG